VFDFYKRVLVNLPVGQLLHRNYNLKYTISILFSRNQPKTPSNCLSVWHFT